MFTDRLVDLAIRALCATRPVGWLLLTPVVAAGRVIGRARRR